MRPNKLPLLIVFCSSFAVARPQQRPSYDFLKTPNSNLVDGFSGANTPPNLLLPAPPVVPSNIAEFNEGIFSEKEQIHDIQLTDLGKRVETLEGTSNWVKGALWAIAFIFVALLSVLGTFWRGIVRVILLEVEPRIARS
jgi:hypothetical protein